MHAATLRDADPWVVAMSEAVGALNQQIARHFAD
jgi:hypothetical protein